QNNTGNHLYIQLIESTGGELARWYGWSKHIAPRVGGSVGPGVDITDGAVHLFAIKYDPATGLCEWFHNDSLQWSTTIATGLATDRIYLMDVARGANDYVYLDDVVLTTEPIILSLVIKPGSCPNPLNTNTKSKGRLPVAILGTDSFDVSEIDIDSISINGTVLPVRPPKIEDVGTPFDGAECECHSTVTDGYNDLVIHFSRREIILALGFDQMEPGTVVPITVEGELLDGTPFEATDCVTLVPRND
ncbi:MAG: hypothetical protein ACYTF1_21235, partial [Planctomycetota bacterium]